MAKSDRWLKPKNLEKLTEWASDKENTIARIASKMGISASTFYNWLNEYDEFREAFDNGRRCVDEEVEIDDLTKKKEIIRDTQRRVL